MIGNIQEAITEMKNGTYNFTVNGECSNCGACCSSLLPLSRREVREIKRYVNKHHIKPHIKSYGVPTAKPISFDLTCPFRDDINRVCTIYPIRPDICRSFRCDKPKKNDYDKNLFQTARHLFNMWEFFA